MFAWNYQDDFLAGYDHGKNAGMMAIADHNVVPGKKFWTWGNGPNGKLEDKLGIKGSSTCQIMFEDTPVPVENMIGNIGEGFKVAMAILNNGRTGLGGGAVGGCGAWGAGVVVTTQAHLVTASRTLSRAHRLWRCFTSQSWSACSAGWWWAVAERDLALLNLYGVVLRAVCNLNLNDPPAALRTLMEGLEFYNRANEKENSNGNRPAAA